MAGHKKTAGTQSANATVGYQQVFKNVDDILHKDAGCTYTLMPPSTP